MNGPLEIFERVFRKSITPNLNFIEGYYQVSNQRRFVMLLIEYLNQTIVRYMQIHKNWIISLNTTDQRRLNSKTKSQQHIENLIDNLPGIKNPLMIHIEFIQWDQKSSESLRSTEHDKNLPVKMLKLVVDEIINTFSHIIN